ncbi:hypothetical protein R1flu_017195 [Riccia fluitans]|uniref:Uncharacterized protein n=1 Tax=Riccia fluitans TaxID=41844 RepID=A0ABD1XE83_9MARC
MVLFGSNLSVDGELTFLKKLLRSWATSTNWQAQVIRSGEEPHGWTPIPLGVSHWLETVSMREAEEFQARSTSCNEPRARAGS